MIKQMSAVLLALCFVCATALAGGVGNAVTPIKTTTEHIGVAVGFENDFIVDRLNPLENKYGPRSMEITDFSRNYGKITVGLSDSSNLYMHIGTGDYDLKFVDRAQDASMEVNLEPGLYTGVGINGLMPVNEEIEVPYGNLSFGVGADTQINTFFNEVDSLVRSTFRADNVRGGFYGVEGQSSVYVTMQYEVEPLETLIIPYIGMYHSWMFVGTYDELRYTSETTGDVGEDFQAAHDFASFGLIFGADFDVAKYLNVSIEGRFIGENAVTTGVSLKF
ncbi:MAG: hypothetical protein NG740_06410 [Omnitrophica bacterium]|nr:hypothetical protein [Candidatus Omnitrophota bacterium]